MRGEATLNITATVFEGNRGERHATVREQWREGLLYKRMLCCDRCQARHVDAYAKVSSLPSKGVHCLRIEEDCSG